MGFEIKRFFKIGKTDKLFQAGVIKRQNLTSSLISLEMALGISGIGGNKYTFEGQEKEKASILNASGSSNRDTNFESFLLFEVANKSKLTLKGVMAEISSKALGLREYSWW